jgi:hypothetical protein
VPLPLVRGLPMRPSTIPIAITLTLASLPALAFDEEEFCIAVTDIVHRMNTRKGRWLDRTTRHDGVELDSETKTLEAKRFINADPDQMREGWEARKQREWNSAYFPTSKTMNNINVLNSVFGARRGTDQPLSVNELGSQPARNGPLKTLGYSEHSQPELLKARRSAAQATQPTAHVAYGARASRRQSPPSSLYGKPLRLPVASCRCANGGCANRRDQHTPGASTHSSDNIALAAEHHRVS